jgi:hypothetical protein
VVVSTPLLNQISQTGFRFFYFTCIPSQELYAVGYLFVDNMDTIQSEQDTQDSRTVARRMQSGMDTLEGGIRVMGVLLNRTHPYGNCYLLFGTRVFGDMRRWGERNHIYQIYQCATRMGSESH